MRQVPQGRAINSKQKEAVKKRSLANQQQLRLSVLRLRGSKMEAMWRVNTAVSRDNTLVCGGATHGCRDQTRYEDGGRRHVKRASPAEL